MTHDLHHDWKSTDSTQSVEGVGAEEASALEASDNIDIANPFVPDVDTKRQVPIKREKSALRIPVTLLMLLIFLPVSAIVFLQGVSVLQGDLLSSNQDQATTSIVDGDEILIPVLIADTEQNSSVLSAVQTSASSSPSVVAVPLHEETIAVDSIESTQNLVATPVSRYQLRTNRFTVGSSLVPDLFAVIPLPIDSVSAAQERAHNAAHPAGSLTGNTPATGPATWILFSLCLVVTIVLFGKKTRRKVPNLSL